jgi:hypothetical protein
MAIFAHVHAKCIVMDENILAVLACNRGGSFYVGLEAFGLASFRAYSSARHY